MCFINVSNSLVLILFGWKNPLLKLYYKLNNLYLYKNNIVYSFYSKEFRKI